MNPFHRRDFLRGAAAVAGTSLLPSLTRVATAQGPTPPANPLVPQPTQVAKGRVVLDRTGKGVPNVRVSNGREIVSTDAQGRYQLPVTDNTIIFIQKPSGYRVPVNELNQPQFYYIHKPQGTPGKTRFPAIAPTGALPASVDFTLIKADEPDEFRVVLWADPQVRDIKEIDYVARDIANDLVGVKAAFGLSLGDNVFNTLSLFRPLQDVMASTGLPWHSVIGNHDLNLDAPDEALSSETFKSFYGPTYYSFDYGQAHFVAMDNIHWLGAGTPLRNGNYAGGFGEQQLAWLKNDLAGVPRDKLVVLCMHIPVVSTPLPLVPTAPTPGDPTRPPRFIEEDLNTFFKLLEDRPHTLSVSGHTHINCHAFLEKADGWNGRVPHHHYNCGTVSGSWWCGAPDEVGIPHATMRDGVPNGYAFLNIKKNDYTIDWRSARKSPDYQMALIVPPQINVTDAEKTLLKVNVFNGSPKTKVETRIGNGPWTTMQRTATNDPGYVALKEIEQSIPAFAKDAPKGTKPPWLGLPDIEATPHIWQAALPTLPTGAHWIRVRATDHWNRTYEDKRLIQIV
jgi:hypothetical protein